MNIRLTVIFFSLFFGFLALLHFSDSGSDKAKPEFVLIEQVPERQLVGRVNVLEFIEDGKEVARDIPGGSMYVFYLEQVKEQLLNSGLKLNEVYYTFSESPRESAMYFSIKNSQKLDEFLKEFIQFYMLSELQSEPLVYGSNEENIFLRKEDKYIILQWGNPESLIDNEREKIANLFRDSILNVKDQFVFNPQGKNFTDKNEFITGSYERDSSFRVSIDWYKKGGVPLRRKSDSISLYPSEESEFLLALNLDKDLLSNYENPWLMTKIEGVKEKVNFNYSEFWSLWNGFLALNFGGETEIEEVNVTTVFDENFNQIEKKEVTVTEVDDFGLLIGTNDPKTFYAFIGKQPNVSLKKGALYFPLSPPLFPYYYNNELLLSSAQKTSKKKMENSVFWIKGAFQNFDFSGLIRVHGENNAQLRVTVSSDNPAPEI